LGYERLQFIKEKISLDVVNEVKIYSEGNGTDDKDISEGEIEESDDFYLDVENDNEFVKGDGVKGSYIIKYLS